MSGFDTKKFRFKVDCEVPSAIEPENMITIPQGVWPVIFDPARSRKGNPEECEVQQTGIATYRILRQALIELCANGDAEAV